MATLKRRNVPISKRCQRWAELRRLIAQELRYERQMKRQGNKFNAYVARSAIGAYGNVLMMIDGGVSQWVHTCNGSYQPGEKYSRRKDKRAGTLASATTNPDTGATMKLCVFNWSDMEQFGIIHLTGESDRYKLRGLFDLTEQGRELFLSFLNLPEDTVLRPNINNTGVASVAIPYSMMTDLAVAGFAKAGHRRIAIVGGLSPYVMGIKNDANDADVDRFINDHKDMIKVIRLS